MGRPSTRLYVCPVARLNFVLIRPVRNEVCTEAISPNDFRRSRASSRPFGVRNTGANASYAVRSPSSRPPALTSIRPPVTKTGPSTVPPGPMIKSPLMTNTGPDTVPLTRSVPRYTATRPSSRAPRGSVKLPPNRVVALSL